MVNCPELKTLKQYQWSSFFHMFYVEPIVFILVFSHSLSGTIMKHEVIHQACTTIFQFNETDCLQLGTKNVADYLQEIETKIQPYVANLLMIRTLIESIVPAICGVFVGSWSDHYGRKPLLLVSMIGFSLTYLTAAVICKLSQYYPVNPWYYVLSVIPHSILGGNCVFSVAVFCYVSDVTDMKTRPFRMISLEAIFSIGLMVGSLLSSFIYAATSATFTFALSGVLCCFATAFIAVYVPESLNHNAKAAESNTVKLSGNEISKTLPMASNHTDQAKKNNEKLSCFREGPQELENVSRKEDKPDDDEYKIKKENDGLFNYRHIKDMWIACFKSRPYNDRSIILLLSGIMFLSYFVLDGSMTVFYLFVREKFQWTIREFSFYETINHVTSVLGALVGFLIMRKVFNLSIVTLALTATVSDITRSVIQGLATEAWHLYIAIAAGALKALGGPMNRTIVSNIVPATDLGKIFSVKNILQSIAPFVAAPLYTLVYNITLTTFPGFFNIMSAIFFLIALVFMLFVLRFKLTNKEHYGQILK